MNHNQQISQPVIFFDGYCNLCNKAVQWVIRQDTKGLFRLAPISSAYAQNNLPPDLLQSVDSIVLFHKGNIYTKSTAVLMIIRLTGGFHKLLYPLIILPAFLRDTVYDWIARNRYQWFGKRNQCMIPTPELKDRFLN